MKSSNHKKPRTVVDFKNGILTITESKDNIREISLLVSAWRVFKSEGGTLEEAQRRLGLTFAKNSVSFNPAPIILDSRECHRTINGISVYSCETVCAELDNCRLKNNQ